MIWERTFWGKRISCFRGMTYHATLIDIVDKQESQSPDCSLLITCWFWCLNIFHNHSQLRKTKLKSTTKNEKGLLGLLDYMHTVHNIHSFIKLVLVEHLHTNPNLLFERTLCDFAFDVGFLGDVDFVCPNLCLLQRSRDGLFVNEAEFLIPREHQDCSWLPQLILMGKGVTNDGVQRWSFAVKPQGIISTLKTKK